MIDGQTSEYARPWDTPHAFTSSRLHLRNQLASRRIGFQIR
jgi:hypothetical protein